MSFMRKSFIYVILLEIRHKGVKAVRFIGRKQELQQLSEAWKKEDALILVTGRPRIGKTKLIKEFVKDKNHLYFAAGNQSDRLNRLSFERIFKSHFGIQAPSPDAAAVEWLELFRLYSEKTEDGGKILIIDNFDQLFFENRSFLKLFKKAWQKYFKANGVTLIVSMSDHSWNQIKQADRGAKKMWTDEIHLNAMSFTEMMMEFPHHDFNQLMVIYSVVGGVPGYWQFFNHCVNIKQIKQSIIRNVTNPYGKLFSEIPNLLEREVWRPATYHSVLKVMAEGAQTAVQIKSMTGYRMSEIRKMLNHLIELGYIQEQPLMFPKKSRKKSEQPYQIALPFVAFWYTFVFSHYDALKNDRQLSKQQSFSGMIPYIQNWFNWVLIEMLQMVSLKKKIGMEVNQVGRYAENNQFIPIVAVDQEGHKIFVADCAYGTKAYSKKDFESFKEHVNQMAGFNKRYRNYDIVYGVFSVYPFEKDLLDFALNVSDLILFNGLTLYSLSK
jgi:AAA+ ATPase superfamily predicted ATPase